MIYEGHTLIQYLTQHALDLLLSVPLAMVGYFVAKAARNAILHRLPLGNADSTIKVFIANCAYSVLIVLVGISVLGILGIPTATLVTIVGASGLAVGLALQGTLSNVAAGLLLVILRPFKVGDVIETNNARGTVAQINIFTTELLTSNNDMIFVPNSKIISDNIINHTAHSARRLDATLSIGPVDNINEIKDILTNTLLADRLILSHPAPSVTVNERTATGYVMSIQVWVKKEDHTTLQSGILDSLILALEEKSVPRPLLLPAI